MNPLLDQFLCIRAKCYAPYALKPHLRWVGGEEDWFFKTKGKCEFSL
jgi:hypothetical protein